MLKIVDYYPNTKIPFPLKELEKFGFTHKSKQWVIREHYSLVKKASRMTTELQAWIDCEDRTIHKGTWADDSVYADILFDLIQAGLVEKGEK